MKFCNMPYERVDLKETEREFKILLDDFKSSKSGEEQFQVHQRFYALTDQVETMMTIAQIRHNIDTTDEFYSKEQDYYDEISPKYNNYVIEYVKLINESPFRKELEEKIGSVA
ncbi:M3 family oligoendopeptidase, partial [bacterium 1XD42-8]